MIPNSSRSYISEKRASDLIERFVPRNKMLRYETIRVRHSYARVLAEDVISAFDIPAFDSSHMDGYAINAQDIIQASERTPIVLRLKEGQIKPDRRVPPRSPLRKQEALRIGTGGFLPYGADSVVPLEETRADGKKNKV